MPATILIRWKESKECCLLSLTDFVSQSHVNVSCKNVKKKKQIEHQTEKNLGKTWA